jgi:hypothetical protein
MKSKIEKAKKALEVLTIYATEGGLLDSEIDVVFDAREDIEEALASLLLMIEREIRYEKT